jgi:PTS system mannose-specific IIA component
MNVLGIVIATHGTLSDGFKDAAEVVIGETNNLETVNLLAGKPVEALGDDITEAIKKVDDGEGVIVYTDLLSASPYNQSVIAINGLDAELQNQVHIISGVSFPMLLEGINHQFLGTPVEQAVSAILEQGNNGIASWNITELAVDDSDDEDNDF